MGAGSERGHEAIATAPASAQSSADEQLGEEVPDASPWRRLSNPARAQPVGVGVGAGAGSGGAAVGDGTARVVDGEGSGRLTADESGSGEVSAPPGTLETPPAPGAPSLEIEDPAGDITDGPSDGGSERTSIRTYVGDEASIETENVTSIRSSARDGQQPTVPVTVRLGDAELTADRTFRRQGTTLASFGRWVPISSDGDWSCSCGQADCEHRGRASEAIDALVNARRIRSGVVEWERAVANSTRRAQQVAADAQAAAASRPPRPEPDGPNWADDPEPFQQVYQQARAARDAGGDPIPYRYDNATGGLGAREGGRPFGIEVEFSLPNHAGAARADALRQIGRDLHNAGLTLDDRQQRYHAGSQSGYVAWSFETDSTVAGEVVSPILYDEPDTWRQIEQVCDIVRRNGGVADTRCGGHVHVGIADYDHTPENHSNLMGLVAESEDVLFRVSQNPQRNRHRGTMWCRPNGQHAPNYRTVGEARDRNYGHGQAVNLQHVRGSRNDHVEFRTFDGSLDPAVIQTQINLSLGLVDTAVRSESRSFGGSEPVGTHRQANSHLRRGQRLTGDAWRANTASFRRLADRLFAGSAQREQLAALFAVTRWQRP